MPRGPPPAPRVIPIERRAADHPVAAGELVDELGVGLAPAPHAGQVRPHVLALERGRATRRSSAGRRGPPGSAAAASDARLRSAAVSAVRARLLVDEVDEPAEEIGVGLGQDAVAEVEDVARAAGGLVEDGQGAGPRRLPAREQAGRVEVALDARGRGRPGASRRRARPGGRAR